MAEEAQLTVQTKREIIKGIETTMRSADGLITKPVIETHFGKEVWTHPLMEVLRTSECLCMKCDKLKPDQPDNCKIANELFEVCVKEDVALAVTRCPEWMKLRS